MARSILVGPVTGAVTDSRARVLHEVTEVSEGYERPLGLYCEHDMLQPSVLPLEETGCITVT
jgi:hypothetical protein